MRAVPVLETTRLVIRPFSLDDLQAIHQILDVDLAQAGHRVATMAERAEWLRWTVANYEQLVSLGQPPYGDRAVVLKANGEVIGTCGLVPYIDTFEQMPGLAARPVRPAEARATAEVGLFWAIAPAHQGRGYATEAGCALAEFALKALRLWRVIATTDYDNLASIAVMRKLGMRVCRNPYPDPPWMQMVAVLEPDMA